MGRIRTAELAFAAAFLLAACGSKDEARQGVAQAVNEEGVTLALCGDVERWTPPAPPNDGALAIGSGHWAVASDARVTGTELLVPHTAVCAAAGLDAQGRIVDCAVTPRGPDPWQDAGAYGRAQ